MAQYNNQTAVLTVNDIKGIFVKQTKEVMQVQPHCLPLVNETTIYDGDAPIYRDLTPMEPVQNIPYDSPLDIKNRQLIAYEAKFSPFYVADALTHEQEQNKHERIAKVIGFTWDAPTVMAVAHDKSLYSATRDVSFSKKHVIPQEPWNDDADSKGINYGITLRSVNRAKEILCEENHFRPDVKDNWYLLVCENSFQALKDSGVFRYSNTGQPGSYSPEDVAVAENYLCCKIVKFPNADWREAGFCEEVSEIGKPGKVLVDLGFIIPKGLYKFLCDNNGIASLGGNINMIIRDSLKAELSKNLISTMETGVTIAGPQKIIKLLFRTL